MGSANHRFSALVKTRQTCAPLANHYKLGRPITTNHKTINNTRATGISFLDFVGSILLISIWLQHQARHRWAYRKEDINKPIRLITMILKRPWPSNTRIIHRFDLGSGHSIIRANTGPKEWLSFLSCYVILGLLHLLLRLPRSLFPSDSRPLQSFSIRTDELTTRNSERFAWIQAPLCD